MLTTIEYTVTAIVCIISAVVIQRIFVKERNRGGNATSVQGIKWFGLAIFTWGIGALGNLICSNGLPHIPKVLIYWGVFISLANSLFIVLSLSSIEHSKERSMLVRLVERFSTKEFVRLYIGVLGMIAFVFLVTSYSSSNISNNFIWLIDIPISVVVAISLLSELNKAFASRAMKFMYLPTYALFVLIIVAVSHRIIPQDQALQFLDQEFWALAGSITAIAFKFLFILLFSILLYSWKFLSEKEHHQTEAEKLSEENLKLLKQKEQLMVANESHLDTIKTLKTELQQLQDASTIEFSERQKEVLGNLAYCGANTSYPELAVAMHISLDGLQTHIHQIKQVLHIKGTRGKEQLITYAQQHNFLQFSTLKDTTKRNA